MNEDNNPILPSVNQAIEGVSFMKEIFMEMEDIGCELPFGDYKIVYDILDDLKDLLEILGL